MIAFFKRYWLNVLLFSILLVSVIYNDSKKQHYFEADDEQLRSIILKIVIVILTVLFLLMLAAFIKGRIKLKNIVSALLGGISLVGGLYFFLYPVFLSAAYLLNSSFVRGTVQKPYIVRYIDKETHQFVLYDLQSGRSAREKSIELNKTISLPDNRDTVIVLYEKGLFGFLSEPRIK